MEPQAQRLQIKVGLFIGLGLIVFVSSILLLGGDTALFTRYTEIRARFSEVQGLFPGSVVSLAGMKVGNIKNIEFVPSENSLEVVMSIDRKFESRLVQGTVAEVRTQGALGDKFIYLIPGELGSAPLAQGALVESIETDFMKLLTSREDGMARVIDLIKELHVFVATINSNGQTAHMVKNIADASAKAKSTLDQLDTLLGDLRSEIPDNRRLRQALTSLANVMEKIDKGHGTLGQLINDPSVHQNLKSFLGGSPRNRYMKEIIRETIQRNEAAK